MRVTGRQVMVVAAAAEREVLQELLESSGYRVAPAPSLDAARDAARQLVAPALVLIDGASGMELARFLSSLRRLRPADFHTLPVVLLSEERGASPAGVSEVVPKPVVASLLLEVVQRLFEGV